MKSSKDYKLISNLVYNMFNYLDSLDFKKLQEDVFATNIFFDLGFVEGEPKKLSSIEVCDIFYKYTKDLDGNDRKMGDLIIRIDNNKANVFTQATITHYKKNTKKGNTRELNGDYHFVLHKLNDNRWKITSFTYKLNQIFGNITLE